MNSTQKGGLNNEIIKTLLLMGFLFLAFGYLTWSNWAGVNPLSLKEELGKNLFFDKISTPTYLAWRFLFVEKIAQPNASRV